jgi:hypothetical protein
MFDSNKSKKSEDVRPEDKKNQRIKETTEVEPELDLSGDLKIDRTIRGPQDSNNPERKDEVNENRSKKIDSGSDENS